MIELAIFLGGVILGGTVATLVMARLSSVAYDRGRRDATRARDLVASVGYDDQLRRPRIARLITTGGASEHHVERLRFSEGDTFTRDAARHVATQGVPAINNDRAIDAFMLRIFDAIERAG
jgi:hypothetical protein